MKKKLRLNRMTIAHLTGRELSGVIGGFTATGPTEGAGVTSVQVDDKIEPCQWPIVTETCGSKAAP